MMDRLKRSEEIETEVLAWYGPENMGEGDVVELITELLRPMSLYGMGAVLERISAMIVEFSDHGEYNVRLPEKK
jgi:hypothetical protein